MGLGLQKYRTATQMVVAGFNFVLKPLVDSLHMAGRGRRAISLLSDATLAAINTIVVGLAMQGA